ncbi:hypothetical protein Amsp01_018370 [Amycolatopsis sp. NBRC 101858]|nr:hypothetical protein Amsp01_018370 [Amycolatopsis sp. NBRC 101858]
MPTTDSVSLTVGKLLTVGICDKATHTLRSDRNPSVSADLDLRLITDQKVANQVGLVNEVKLTTWQLSVAVQTARRRLTEPEVRRRATGLSPCAQLPTLCDENGGVPFTVEE